MWSNDRCLLCIYRDFFPITEKKSFHVKICIVPHFMDVAIYEGKIELRVSIGFVDGREFLFLMIKQRCR